MRCLIQKRRGSGSDTIAELFDLRRFSTHAALAPRRRRVAIVTSAGGPGIMATGRGRRVTF